MANGGAQLAAAFNAAVANFPSPAEFVNAVTGALGGGLQVVQQVFNQGAAALEAGLNAGVALGNQIINALGTGLVRGRCGTERRYHRRAVSLAVAAGGYQRACDSGRSVRGGG